MYLKKIALRSVRNYKRLDLDLGPGLNLFAGDNAKGKTNLLEAVSLLASLRSFRGVKPQAVLSWDEGDAKGEITGEVVGQGGQRGQTRQGVRRLAVSLSSDGRRVVLDGKRPGAREYLLALKVSVFSPEDLFLVREYPSHRRRFLDRSVFHTFPGYIDLVNRCRGAVKQLNAALKAGDGKVVASWEDVLAPLAAEVSALRRERVDVLGPKAAVIYEKVLGGGNLGFTYRCAAKGCGRDELDKAYRELLEKKRDEGLRKGYCPVGPHADDLVVTLSGRDIKTSASRGQGRLALLALVLADGELYR